MLAVRHAAQDVARLMFRVIHQVLDAFVEGFDAEFGHHLLDLALAGIHRADEGLEVAPVLFRLAHVGHHHVEQFAIQFAALVELAGREADTFLVDFDQAARQARRDRTADVGIVDMSAGKRDQLALVEDRFPHMQVRRMGRDVAAIGIVGEGDVAFFVAAIDHVQRIAVIEPREPSRTQVERDGEGLARRRQQPDGEILGLLHEGGMRRSVQRVGHALGRGTAMVREDFKRYFVDRHLRNLPANRA